MHTHVRVLKTSTGLPRDSTHSSPLRFINMALSAAFLVYSGVMPLIKTYVVMSLSVEPCSLFSSFTGSPRWCAASFSSSWTCFLPRHPAACPSSA